MKRTIFWSWIGFEFRGLKNFCEPSWGEGFSLKKKEKYAYDVLKTIFKKRNLSQIRDKNFFLQDSQG